MAGLFGRSVGNSEISGLRIRQISVCKALHFVSVWLAFDSQLSQS